MKRSDLEALAEALAPLIRDYVAASVENIKALIPAAVPGIPGTDGKDGENGRDGMNGKDADPELVLAQVREWLEPYIEDCKPGPAGKDGADGKDGRDGADGIDGKSVTVDDLQPLFEGWMAKFELAFDRRAQEILQRAVDRLEKPKDGKDGAPGRDALSVEDFDVALSDDERTLTVSLKAGERVVSKSVRLSHPVHRGVYQAGKAYQKGDCVTFGGSTWSATRDTDAKPETDDSWKLAVKRGRDGKGA
jgi:hypothetical protein